jgi:EpsI family protein
LAINPKKAAIILAAILVVQAGGYFVVAREEAPPTPRPLSEFPKHFDDWNLAQEGVIEKRVQEVLNADDLLTRSYIDTRRTVAAHLYIAYFGSQRSGQSPHSPKNCLPGAGWTPKLSDTIDLPLPGREAKVNRYLVTKGERSSLVLYWYQTGTRVVASEYLAKVHLVFDSLRYNRSDTALVRVVVPVVNENFAEAESRAVQFATDLFTPFEEFPQFQDAA